MSKEAMKLALKRAFQLGQDYWYQADHDSYMENKKSDETLAKFRQLVDETCEALAEQSAQRKPLTREQVKAIMAPDYNTATMQERADFMIGFRAAEAAHNIKENT